MTVDDDFDSQTRLPIIRGWYPYGSWPCISCTNNALFSVYTLCWRICLFRNMIAAILFGARGSTYLDIGSNFASCHRQINPAFSSFIRARVIRTAIERERSGRVNNFCCCHSNACVRAGVRTLARARARVRTVYPSIRWNTRWVLIPEIKKKRKKKRKKKEISRYYCSLCGICLRFLCVFSMENKTLPEFYRY